MVCIWTITVFPNWPKTHLWQSLNFRSKLVFLGLQFKTYLCYHETLHAILRTSLYLYLHNIKMYSLYIHAINCYSKWYQDLWFTLHIVNITELKWRHYLFLYAIYSVLEITNILNHWLMLITLFGILNRNFKRKKLMYMTYP